mmetsp:Transcript_4996/g.9091  ORF Transcript_4996/g.9091 Transcript_4996/m.9091 type:complete len:135 (-) Transcript_4996:567-971(-)|eukprot:CAMPEP_0177755808 /NCGR_PEP_ID=MMETSP0491_2-20121128/2768_1 /TAXON_ID=63592 /ORGANISM="Tetraselmis chuii, Strain PLY429" /LENGTH=134 /DNA_ID=CAMNT_0019271339 /DNA_START=935 /DNA_END=1339 /DNA_ORIENTATION=-
MLESTTRDSRPAATRAVVLLNSLAPSSSPSTARGSKLTEVNKASASIWSAAVKGDFSVVDTIFAPDADICFCGSYIKGVAALKNAMLDFLSSCRSPDLVCVVDKLADDGRTFFTHSYFATWRKGMQLAPRETSC